MSATSLKGTGFTPGMEITGVSEAVADLRGITDRAEDMRPAMYQIRELLIAAHTKNFRSRGGYFGTPWKPNAPATIARKARTGVPSLSSTMVESGDLQESLEGGAGSHNRVTRSMVRVGTSLFYAVFHIKPKRAGMPARPTVGVTEREEEAAVAIVDNRLMGRML